MFGTQKAQAKNFAWWVAPLSLGTPLSERKLRRNLFFHVFLPAYEWDLWRAAPKLNPGTHWHWQRWRSEPCWFTLETGSHCCWERNACCSETLIYVMLIPPSTPRLESSEIQAQCTKWLFQNFDSPWVPWTLAVEALGLNEWEGYAARIFSYKNLEFFFPSWYNRSFHPVTLSHLDFLEIIVVVCLLASLVQPSRADCRMSLPTLCSVATCWEVEICHAGCVYITENQQRLQVRATHHTHAGC